MRWLYVLRPEEAVSGQLHGLQIQMPVVPQIPCLAGGEMHRPRLRAEIERGRQTRAVARAAQSVAAAREALETGMPPDAVLTESEEAMAALGELSGRTVRDDITEQIFARFCVGK